MLREDRLRLGYGQKNKFFFAVALALHYLCFEKIGCGSAKANKNKFFFALALALHYLCFEKIGCGSAKANKNKFFFALALALHYLCTCKSRNKYQKTS